MSSFERQPCRLSALSDYDAASRHVAERVLKGGDMHEPHEDFIEWATKYDVGNIEGKTFAWDEAHLKTQTCPVLELRDVISTVHATDAILTALDSIVE